MLCFSSIDRRAFYWPIKRGRRAFVWISWHQSLERRATRRPKSKWIAFCFLQQAFGNPNNSDRSLIPFSFFGNQKSIRWSADPSRLKWMPSCKVWQRHQQRNLGGIYYIQVIMYVNKHIHIHIGIYLCIYIYTHIYICIYLHIHIQIHIARTSGHMHVHLQHTA